MKYRHYFHFVTLNHCLATAVLVVLFASAACRKEEEGPKYNFTADELQWLPYENVGFQPFYMKDETGYIHHLNLHNEMMRDMRYFDPSTGNAQLYYKENYVHIHFGRHGCTGIFRKDIHGLELSFYGQGKYAQVFSDYELKNPIDSVNVHGRIFYNVLVAELDTTIVDPDVDIELWKIYVAKGLGVVGADYRNGQYYVME